MSGGGGWRTGRGARNVATRSRRTSFEDEFCCCRWEAFRVVAPEGQAAREPARCVAEVSSARSLMEDLDN